MASGELSFWLNRALPAMTAMQRAAVIAAVSGGAAFAVYRKYTAIKRDALGPSPSTPSLINSDDGDAADAANSQSGNTKKKDSSTSVKVDRVFLRRLRRIIGIILPSVRSREMLHLVMLTALLFGRTVLSIKVADITGDNVQSIVERDWRATLAGIWRFALVGVPASIVNSALQYETDILSLYFRRRLSDHVNKQYLKGVNFYKASNLGGENNIDNADQRVTADIVNFCAAISNLYTTIFKPLVDVFLFSRKLMGVIGLKAPILLFCYYVFMGTIKRFMMPAFGKLAARESELEGNYRMAHQRLIVNSEEIAFYDGSTRELDIILRLFMQLFRHHRYVLWRKLVVGVWDTYLVKYGASIVGYIILCFPVFSGSADPNKSAADLARDYVRNRVLLINLAQAIGRIILMSNRVTQLAGHTSRVSELLEMVEQLERSGTKPFTIRDDETSVLQPLPSLVPETDSATPASSAIVRDRQYMTQWLVRWRERAQSRILARHAAAATPERASPARSPSAEGGRVIHGTNSIKFDDVSIVTPDGKLLVEHLTFQVNPHSNIMITGANGTGKSSLFRILGELWPVSRGTVEKPPKSEILFVPQKPYLVLGTLRDQIIYPHSRQQMLEAGINDDDLTHLMDVVDPSRIMLRQWRFDEERDWFHAFSGGQKQRIAMARLFYHMPTYAILDECTSAVSDEVENIIYESCKLLGITLFTVSHRPNLRIHHEYQLKFTGNGGWELTAIEA